MKKTNIIIIVAVLVGYVFGYIFGRQDEYMKQAERIESLEYEIDDIKADYYNDGFNACLEQF